LHANLDLTGRTNTHLGLDHLRAEHDRQSGTLQQSQRFLESKSLEASLARGRQGRAAEHQCEGTRDVAHTEILSGPNTLKEYRIISRAPRNSRRDEQFAIAQAVP
jgi:hypothetical protein